MTVSPNLLEIDAARFDGLKASRKPDRGALATALTILAERHGATVRRKDDPRLAGYHGAGITLHIECAGVGAMLSINDTHGGSYALIHWHNASYPVRNFTSRFSVAVGGNSGGWGHHKTTSCPDRWYALAIALDAGLLLAARGKALELNPL